MTSAAAVNPVPEDYHAVTPYLCVSDATRALEFYKQAFGATELMRLPQANGSVGHAEIKIGDSRIMLADECPEVNFRSPHTIGGSPVNIYLYVEDVDRTAAQSVAAGARLVSEVKDHFYGDRSGTLEDPFGHVWHVSTRKEDVSPEEVMKRMASAGNCQP